MLAFLITERMDSNTLGLNLVLPSLSTGLLNKVAFLNSKNQSAWRHLASVKIRAINRPIGRAMIIIKAFIIQ